jgi:hypothetical protein
MITTGMITVGATIPPVLQKDDDHDHHQGERFEQRVKNRADRLFDEPRRVVKSRVL